MELINEHEKAHMGIATSEILPQPRYELANNLREVKPLERQRTRRREEEATYHTTTDRDPLRTTRLGAMESCLLVVD